LTITCPIGCARDAAAASEQTRVKAWSTARRVLGSRRLWGGEFMRCQALVRRGRLCGNRATKQANYYGDINKYSKVLGAIIHVCDRHDVEDLKKR